MNLTIKEALIVDGTGEKPYRGSIRICGERIVSIEKTEDVFGENDASAGEAIKTAGKEAMFANEGLSISDEGLAISGEGLVISGEDLIVTPGFIDTHGHSDLMVLTDRVVAGNIAQGITTTVTGQDGVSLAPLPEERIDEWRENLKNLDGDSDAVDWHYLDTAGYLSLVEKTGTTVNTAYLVPHGNLRMAVMGFSAESPTEEELGKMCALLRKELSSGAFGLSTGLIYTPCLYAEKEELTALCRVAAEYGGVFAVHMRSEGNDMIAAAKEVIRIAGESGVHLHISHFKVQGKKNFHKTEELLALLDDAKEEGIRITFDQYPYIAGSTTLSVVLPPWALEGGNAAVLRRLADPAARKAMTSSIENGIPGWDNFADSVGFDNIYVTDLMTEKNRDAVGIALTDFAKKRGKNVFDAVYDLLLEEENHVTMIDYYGSEEILLRLMKRPEMNICTDGLIWSRRPHPRAYGACIRLLEKYVRDEKALTLEEAVAKMTGCSALSHNIAGRGFLKEGYFADINVLKMSALRETGTFSEPCAFPEGLEYCLVNGEIVWEKGHFTGNYPGRVLRYAEE